MTMLDPDIGSGTAAPPPQTALSDLVAQIAAPRLPDDLATKIDQNLGTTPPPAVDTTGLDTGVVIPNLPDARQAFVTKYRRLGPSLGNLSPAVKSSLVDFDLQRVNKGQSPLTDRETLAAIVAATKKEAVTKAPKDDSILGRIKAIPGAVGSDLALTLKAIPHLPVAVYDELVHHLPKFADEYEANLHAGMNPLAALANSPGIRFIPGSFIVGNLAQGGKGVGNLLDHPLITALDALPYASKAAAATDVGRVAASEAGAAGEAGLVPGGKVRPIRAVLTRQLLPEGETTIEGSRLAPNRLGKVTQAAAATKLGSYVTETWGQSARAFSRINAVADQRFADILGGHTDPGQWAPVRKAYQQAAGKALEDFGVTPDRAAQIGDLLQIGENGHAFIDELPAKEAGFARQILELRRQFDTHATTLPEFGVVNGEVYDIDTAKRMQTTGDRQAKLTDDLRREVLPRLDQLVAEQATSKTERVAQARALKLRSDLGNALDPDHPGTLKAVVNDLVQAKKGRVAYGSSVSGEAAGPAANIRIDTLGSIERQIRRAYQVDRAATKLAEIPPARFHSLIQKLAADKITGQLVDAGADPEAAIRSVMERDYQAYPDVFTKDVLTDVTKDIAKTWQSLRDEGYDPMFVHRVSRSREALLRMPKVSEYVPKVTSTKARSLLDPVAYNRDVTVAMAHEGMEWVARDVSQQYVDTILGSFGIPESKLREHLLPRAREIAAEHSTHDTMGILESLMSEGHRPYSPESFQKFPAARLTDTTGERMWLPKGIVNNLDQIHDPTPSALFKGMAPVTRVFRTAVLPLSPRWHLYNIIGGAIPLLAERGPGAFGHMFEARRIINALGDGEVLGADGRMLVPDELRAALGGVRKETVEFKNFTRGSKLAEVMKPLTESRVGQAGSSFVQKSYDLNSWFDDTYRVMSYLHGKKGAFGDGMAADAAERAGLESTRRTAQFWNELTPNERNVIRQVFPFYAFTSYIMRFVTRFPFDHPVRASVMANIANAEMSDQKDGLGMDWLDSIGLGPVDAHGRQTRLSLRGLNPFSDVGDQFTLAGFLAGMNPALKTVAEQLGATVGGGAPYATQRYDPATGRLVDRKPGLLASLVTNTIPQADLVLRLTGKDPEFNALLRTNPDAARRMLVSGAGAPNLTQQVNVPQEYMKAELARQTAQRTAFTDALKTGDWSEAEKYPALRPLLDQVRKLREQGALAPYNPTAGAAGGVRALPGAVVRSAVPWPT